MTAGIFYLSLTKGNDRQAIRVPQQLARVYIRVETVECSSLEHALDLASPRAGEMVMNTHPVTMKG